VTQSIELRDCVLVSAVIKVDNVEMGSYRALVSSAELMDHADSILR
jgi:ferritin-like metal-binding protein YciE